jgi:hypothetical protein
MHIILIASIIVAMQQTEQLQCEIAVVFIVESQTFFCKIFF